MSWRLLFFTLLVLAGVATVGGLYAGDWLIEHAPRQANLPNFNENEPAPQVGPDGVPLLRQPPQPLMSGKLGIPDKEVKVDWQVKADNLSKAKTASVSSSSTASAAAPRDNATSSVSSGGSTSQAIKTRPINQNNAAAPRSGGGNWEAAFRREIAACRQLGFFERASCVGNVREKYCGANKAWGKVNDCPAR
ncbi:MAG: hypothetical protein SOX43_07165 [Pelistega sp.]|nr:hypothetical protein [Pelistega sp.]